MIRFVMPKNCEPMHVLVRLKTVGEGVVKNDHILMLKTHDGHLITVPTSLTGKVSYLAEQLQPLDEGESAFELQGETRTIVLNMLTREAVRRHIERKQNGEDVGDIPEEISSSKRRTKNHGVASEVSRKRTIFNSKSSYGLFIIALLLAGAAFFMTQQTPPQEAVAQSTDVEEGVTNVALDTEPQEIERSGDLYQASRAYIAQRDDNFYARYLDTVDLDVATTPIFIKRRDGQDALRPLEEGEYLIANRFTYKHPTQCVQSSGRSVYTLVIRDPITRQVMASRMRTCPDPDSRLIAASMTQSRSNDTITVSSLSPEINRGGQWQRIGQDRISTTLPTGCQGQEETVRYQVHQETFDLNLGLVSSDQNTIEAQRIVLDPGC